MKIYKYRDLRPNDQITAEEALRRACQVAANSHWCARPDALNDPDEFSVGYDYTVRAFTRRLLPGILIRYHSTLPERAVSLAASMTSARLEEISRPIVAEMVSKCREEIGLISYSLSKDDPLLWERYGGEGEGVCIEIDVPDVVLQNGILRPVDYVTAKRWHVDTLFESALFDAFICFSQLLLTKTEQWQPENEVRFVSNRQNVSMAFEHGAITEVMFGSKVTSAMASEMKAVLSQWLPGHSIVFTNR